MFQRFLRFSEFAGFSEFNESSAPFRENPNRREIQILLKINRTAEKIRLNRCDRKRKRNKQTNLSIFRTVDL